MWAMTGKNAFSEKSQLCVISTKQQRIRNFACVVSTKFRADASAMCQKSKVLQTDLSVGSWRYCMRHREVTRFRVVLAPCILPVNGEVTFENLHEIYVFEGYLPLA